MLWYFGVFQFAMGLNMPAKTVVFTAVRKWDGDSHRWMSSGEYIQVPFLVTTLLSFCILWILHGSRMACCAGKEIQQLLCNAPLISVVFLLPSYLLLCIIFDALPNHLKDLFFSKVCSTWPFTFFCSLYLVLKKRSAQLQLPSRQGMIVVS